MDFCSKLKYPLMSYNCMFLILACIVALKLDIQGKKERARRQSWKIWGNRRLWYSSSCLSWEAIANTGCM